MRVVAACQPLAATRCCILPATQGLYVGNPHCCDLRRLPDRPCTSRRVVSFLEARADARWWLLLYFSASLALCGAYWLSKGPAKLVPRTPYKRSALRLSVLALGCACLFGACRHPLAGVVVVCVALLLRSQTSAASLGATVLDTASLFFPDQHPSQRRKTTVAPMTDEEMIQQSLRHTADELSGLQRFASQHR